MFPIFAGNSASTGYNLTRSLRFRASATPWLNRTLSAGNQKTWTWSGWVKRGTLTSAQAIFDTGVLSTSDSTFARFGFDSSDAFNFTAYTVSWRTTTQVFRDPSAWYHIVLTFDTTQATAANRVKIYINGVQVTAFSTSADPTLNTNYAINQAAAHYFGYPAYSYGYFDGYLAEVNFIDGQALTPSSFGSTNALTGVWQPARYTGTYGTNGFYLPFTDNSALTTSSNVGLGKDFSGNGNYWVTNNISLTAGVTYDSMTDVPTLTSATAANFAVLNPLKNSTPLSYANLRFTGSSAAQYFSTGTIGVTSGKYYFEAIPSAIGGGASSIGIGVAKTTVNIASVSTSDVFFYNNNATKYGGGAGNVSYGSTYTTGDLIGIALDMDAGTVSFYKNNVSQGVAFSSLTGLTIMPFVSVYDTSAGDINFGQRPFTYTPPTGFVALNTFNLPDSTIVKGNTVMDATTFTGVTAGATVTNAAGFKPDFVWMKNRSAARNNELLNSVTGGSSTLFSNLTNAQATDQRISSFNSNGFTYTSNSNSANTGESIVGWQWQAGQGSTSSNTNGTITSTVSVNASAGFSVVTYTGTAVAGTIGHGLGVAPQLIIVKPRTGTITTDAWNVYHVSIGNTQFLALNATDAATTATNRWNSTSPTSSVFSIGTVPSSVAVGYVAYCWTPIAGFSAFGSYTGNGSADGPFVYTGFRPKFVLIKRTDGVGNWSIYDTARDTYNVMTQVLYPNLSDAETNNTATVDYLSNGFKLRIATFQPNTSGATFVYAAFAENPFKNSLAR